MSTTDSRAAFEAWAEREGCDTANTHDGVRVIWLSPMTADLWAAWQAATEAAKATGTAVHKLCEIFDIKIPEGMTPEMAIACRLKDLEDAIARAVRQPAPVLNNEQREKLEYIANWMDSSVRIIQNAPDDYGPASQFDYDMGQAAHEILSILAATRSQP